MNQTTEVTWSRLRKLVKNRDGSKCFHCGKLDENGECDHLMPLAKGGTDSILNLVWSCVDCNRKKGTKIPPQEIAREQEVTTKNKPQKVKPLFENIIPELINSVTLSLIPPYPEYEPFYFDDFNTYFDIIEIQRSIPILSWLRLRIWELPQSVKNVLIALDTLDKIKKRITKSSVVWNFREECTECKCPIVFKQYEDKIKWICPAGHYGEYKVIKTEDWLKTTREDFIQWAFYETYPHFNGLANNH